MFLARISTDFGRLDMAAPATTALDFSDKGVAWRGGYL
jgi:hypothetical protein